MHKYCDIVYTDDKTVFINYEAGDVLFIPGRVSKEEFVQALSNSTDEAVNKIWNRANNSLKTREEYFQEFLSSHDLLHLILLPNEGCNFRCVYCFEDFSKPRRMTTVIEPIKKYIKKYAGSFDHLFLEWFGGEPLLEVNTITDLNNYGKSVNKSFHSHITTNGYYLTVENMKKLVNAEARYFTITLDGDNTTHDHTRILADGHGTFDVIFNNLLMLNKTDLDFHIKIRCNVSSSNAEGIDRLLEKMKSLDTRFHDINIRLIRDYNNDLNKKILSSQGVVNSLIAKAKRYGYFDSNLPTYLRPHGNICPAAQPNTYIIGADGSIMRCDIDLRSKDRNIIGYLNSNGEMVIDEEKQNKYIYPIEKEECRSCKAWITCMASSCPKARLDGQGIQCPSAIENLTENLNLLQ